MKRRELIRHLVANGCQLVREGANHSWWENPGLNRRSAMPRHTEVNRFLGAKNMPGVDARNKSKRLNVARRNYLCRMR